MTNVPESPVIQMTQVDFGKFLHGLEKQTHAGIAMILSARLEQTLVTIIQSNMPNLSERLKPRLFEGYGPLASFSAKIDMAYVSGYIKEYERKILHAVREIRNEFAHSENAELSFEHDAVIKLLSKLPPPLKNGQRHVRHFMDAVSECSALLNKHLDTLYLVKALKDRADKSKSAKEKSEK